MIGLQAGLDWGAPDFSTFSDPSWSTGIQLEYQYARNYFLSTGLTYNRKAYLAEGTQYEAPPGFWHGKPTPAEIKAVCDMLELPVRIGYHFKGYRQSGFFATAGLTSYLMLKESYDYAYDEVQNGQKPSWEGRRENQHWFGIGQFSVGYQKVISPRANLQVAPFIQVPLTGVGHGNVKLYTVGAHLRFSFQAI
jgi:hypothetical protein